MDSFPFLSISIYNFNYGIKILHTFPPSWKNIKSRLLRYAERIYILLRSKKYFPPRPNVRRAEHRNKFYLGVYSRLRTAISAPLFSPSRTTASPTYASTDIFFRRVLYLLLWFPVVEDPARGGTLFIAALIVRRPRVACFRTDSIGEYAPGCVPSICTR